MRSTFIVELSCNGVELECKGSACSSLPSLKSDSTGMSPLPGAELSFLLFLGESMVGNETEHAKDLPSRGWFLMIVLIRVSSMGFVCVSNMNKELHIRYKITLANILKV